MKLEDILKISGFRSERHKSILHLLSTSYKLRTVLNNTLKEKGLTMEQYNVLRILKGAENNQLCVKEISIRLIEKTPNVPRTASRLIVKKLISKSESQFDKRETILQLTSQGIELLHSATEILITTEECYNKLSEQEATQLNHLLEKLL